MSKTRVLITGSPGQVGSHLVSHFEDSSILVAAVGPGEAGEPQIDFTDEQAIRQLVRDFKPRIIINPAAYTAVDRAETETTLAHQINAVAPGILAEEAARLDSLLIHYSTDYVFDGSGDTPWRESDACAPQNIYGQTKLDGELAVQNKHRKSFIIRTSWVVSSVGQNFIKTMLRLGQEREELSIIDDQKGAPACASDLARLTAHVVSCCTERGKQWTLDHAGVYHLTSQGTTSWYEIARFVFATARAQGMELKVKKVHAIPTSQYPTPAVRPLNSRLDCSRFSEVFDQAPVAWQDGVRDIVTELIN